MPVKSPAMAMFLEPFKAAAAEGAAVELKLRLLAGTIPALYKGLTADYSAFLI